VKRVDQDGDRGGGILVERFDYEVNVLGTHERFVSLNVDDDVTFYVGCGLGDPIGAGLVSRARENDFATPPFHGVRNLGAVGRDKDVVQRTGSLAALVNVRDKRYPTNVD
jgi:hypothetical protein